MGTYIEFIVLGFVAGSVYAILGMSLVSVYTSAGLVNFAPGRDGDVAGVPSSRGERRRFLHHSAVG